MLNHKTKQTKGPKFQKEGRKIPELRNTLLKPMLGDNKHSDFIAYFGMQPMSFKFRNKNPNKILRLGKNIQIGKIQTFLDWEAVE